MFSVDKPQYIMLKLQEVFPGQEKLIKDGFFLLQRHYFSCKNHFDIHTLNSTYTQASNCNCLKCTFCLRLNSFIEVANVFVHRWRRRACIKPWGSWICCLTTLRRIWLRSGAETSPEKISGSPHPVHGYLGLVATTVLK